MEDRWAVTIDGGATIGAPAEFPRCALFGLYDGHNGEETCAMLTKLLHERLLRSPSFVKAPVSAFTEGFLSTDAEARARARRGPTFSPRVCVVL